MADSKNLGFVGFMLGGVTAAVMAIGIFVVHCHLDGRLSLDDAQQPVASASVSRIAR
jgi:hypothetical protein